MYNTRRHTRKFDTDTAEDMKEYEDVLNDPLCSILAEVREKLNTTTYGDDGKPIHSEDRLIMVVTWEEKYLP